MTLVLVHNNAHRNEAEARAARRTKTAMSDEHYWNLWRRRIQPFDLLTDGTPIVLQESWPGGGVISWLVHATNVHTATVADKRMAVQAIAQWANETPAWVRRVPYTRAKPADTKFVLYWQPKPIDRLDVPKHADLHVRRNGWLVTDDSTLKTWGVPLGRGIGAHAGQPSPVTASARRQGRRLDVAAKMAVEDRGMTVAKAWCKAQGWTAIQDVSATSSWDVEAVDSGGDIRHIEVKATTGQGVEVDVTKNEVNAARTHGSSHCLVVVRDIVLTVHGGRFRASGGAVVSFDPWLPTTRELTAQAYRWRPAVTR